jgi:transposase
MRYFPIKEKETTMNISVIGLDIAKQIFHLVGLDGTGRGVLKKKLRRSQVLAYFANLGSCTVGLEGCAGCHYWARELTKLGHHAKILPAQHQGLCAGQQERL